MTQSDKRELTVGTADDHRDHILVYLFAMLLPFYSEDIGTWRDFGATLAALAFIVFLFWHLNLHYMNLSVRGTWLAGLHRLSTGRWQRAQRQDAPGGHHSSRQPRSWRWIVAYRLSDTVYLEADA